MTGMGDIQTCVNAMKAGAVDFLTKPIDRTRLAGAIDQALRLDAEQRLERAICKSLEQRLQRLSPREREVMTHVILGRLNKQIAADLGDCVVELAGAIVAHLSQQGASVSAARDALRPARPNVRSQLRPARNLHELRDGAHTHLCPKPCAVYFTVFSPVSSANRWIAPTAKVPITAFVRFDGPRRAMSDRCLHGSVDLYDENRTTAVQADTYSVPLESDPSAALAYRLEGSSVWDFDSRQEPEQMYKAFDNPLLIFSVSFLVLWLTARVGSSLLRTRRRLEDEAREDFGVILAATLTLLGLLIGFSFSMAASRYDQRKIYEGEEANAIGTEFVRAGLLPVADTTTVRALLRKYLDQRVAFYVTSDEHQLREINTRTAQLQSDLWSAVQVPATAQPSPVIALTLSGMNDVLNSQGYAQAAWWNRIPNEAWVLMVVLAICCNLLQSVAWLWNATP
jgi:hypothetical protein